MPAPEAERIPDWIKIVFMTGAALESIRIELKLRKISKLMNEKEKELTLQDGEPVPPDPNTATQEQIENYKKEVLKAATSSHN